MCFDMLFAGAIHTVNQAKIDAARVTQKSGNELRGSSTALQQFSASLGNKRRMDAAGAQVNDIAGNSARLEQSLTHATMEGRIRAAEELGSVSAMAGAAGVGGASVDAYNETVRLTEAMKQEAAQRSVGQQEWASGQQRGEAIKSAVAGMDNNNYRANIDYTQYVDDKKPSMFERVVGLGLTAAATVYGGPQAGAAVAGAFEGIDDMRNGNIAAGSKAFTGAVQNGLAAVGNLHATSGGGSGSSGTSADKALDDLSSSVLKTPIAQAPGASFFNNSGDYGLGSITIN